jgi:hypothetical protein
MDDVTKEKSEFGIGVIEGNASLKATARVWVKQRDGGGITKLRCKESKYLTIKAPFNGNGAQRGKCFKLCRKI